LTFSIKGAVLKSIQQVGGVLPDPFRGMGVSPPPPACKIDLNTAHLMLNVSSNKFTRCTHGRDF